MFHIEINSGIEAPVLAPETLAYQLTEYSEQLIAMANKYKELADFIVKNKVEVKSSYGTANFGGFEVDEIDHGILMHAGLVQEYSETTPFYTIDDQTKTANELMVREVQNMVEAGQGDGRFFDMINNVHVDDLNDDEPLPPGVIKINHEKIDDSTYAMTVEMEDLFDDPVDVTYDHASQNFSYKCVDCEETHNQNLKTAYGSLRTVIAFFSNFLAVTEETGPEDLAMAMESMYTDVKLLSDLIKADYAVEVEKGG